MTRRTALAAIFSAAATSIAFAAPPKGKPKRMSYPQTKTVEQTDTYHGTAVRDPYRWLEDANSAETAAWVEAQNKVTFGYLRQIPGRERIQKRLTALWDYEKFGVPFKEGGQYFYNRNTGLQNQSVLYTTDTLSHDARVLIDPNMLSKDGTVALAGTSVSEDGKQIAYATADAGSDWQTWHVRDIATGKDTADLIKWAKFTGASWSKDNKGFYYSRYDEPKANEALQQANYFQKVYYHAVGTDQSADRLVYKRDNQKEWGFGAGETEDGKYLILYVSQGTEKNNRVFYSDLTHLTAEQKGGGVPVVELLNKLDASYSFVGNDGGVFYFQTDKNAPRSRIVAIDTAQPDETHWREVVPQAQETLQSVSLFGSELIVSYLKDARTQIKRFDLSGKFIGEVVLPGIGSAGGFGGRRDATETFYSFTGFTTPTTIYHYDIKTAKSEVYKKPKVDFDPDKFETKQVFYTSKDGTRIPMFVTHKKGMKLDGTNPTILYGYGGFNASMTPYFSPANAVWMEMGGIYAVANIRGGGEYGESWYVNGRRDKKQNVFDDFIAAGEYLIKEKYTSTPKLAIQGGSNGGLLVGACLTQRPDLFGAALPAVGVMDMLRFNKFTIGWAWASDYGEPDKSEADFKTNLAYSPYHNIKPGVRYPATLVTTSDHDDRVVPAHSFKFAAALQAAQATQGSDAPPTLIRIETRAGHGAGKPTAKVIEEIADIYGFLSSALEFNLPKGF